MEEMLVSGIMPLMSIYRLPLGQYGYTGHVINFPQDAISFAHSLPKLPSELDVLVIRKEKENVPDIASVRTLETPEQREERLARHHPSLT